MRFDIITIFPDIFNGFAEQALIARAQKKKIVSINLHSLRDWTADAHKTVDDRPYGGGAGMVMMVEPIMKAVKDIKKKGAGSKSRVVIFSPKGKKFTQATARRYAKLDQLILISGRYEGIDERVAEYIADEEISIGDYVLFGGEVPAMVVIEAVTRLLPGAVGKLESLKDETFNSAVKNTIAGKQQFEFIEYPHYTRPDIIEINGKKRQVPKVLLSGDHKKIEEWRKRHSTWRARKI
ncbi:MAG: tRNA (guanine-N(1)-)-methyltransferase [Parcubacteria group bacterium Licking1014_17]|nr:MAG: tRNA (guanine-N(1)-)-methyltransferase [Parcubacteria group bacterium Licking1014_17]